MGLEEGSILIIGPGPVAIGQGSYQQYIAARACRLLRRRGRRVIVLENDPATLMDLDGDEQDLYMEPASPDVIERVARESGAGTVLYGLGGRRGLLAGLEMSEEGRHHAIPLATPDLRSGIIAGNRHALRKILAAGGMACQFYTAGNPREGQEAASILGFPLVVRPDFSWAGWGSGLAYNLEEYPALLNDALRASRTGHVLIERSLSGWRKYIMLLARACDGGAACLGMIEQLQALPDHDGDSVLISPPASIGREQAGALREAALRIAESLGLSGLSEVKLCMDPGGEGMAFIDLNSGPGRHTPLLEAACGEDLVRLHLELIMGGPLPPGRYDREPEAVSRWLIAVPELSGMTVGAEGYLSLACHASGRRVFAGRDIVEAGLKALGDVAGEPASDPTRAMAKSIECLLRDCGARVTIKGGGAEGRPPDTFCVSKHAEDISSGLLFVGPKNALPDAGFESESNCTRAIRGLKEKGTRTCLLSPDLDFALFAADEADAVYLGQLNDANVGKLADDTGLARAMLHFCGPAGLSLSPSLVSHGIIPVANETGRDWRTLSASLRQAGIPVCDSVRSNDAGEARALVGRMTYPLHATIHNGPGPGNDHLLYSMEDVETLLADAPEGKEIEWHEVPEDAQEIQAEVVAGIDPADIILFWEQLDEALISSSDGLAVCPPFYLTSHQQAVARDLLSRAVKALGLRGNISFRLFLKNGEARVERMEVGASPNLPFLERASGLPLAAMGAQAILGAIEFEPDRANGFNVVRMPVIPYPAIADSDILPSPRRRSIGCVLGVASNPAAALAKALWSQGIRPQSGRMAFLSVANREKRRAILLARELQEAGYCLMATRGTAHALALAGIRVETVNKLKEGRPNILDHIRNGEVGLVINIPRGKSPHSDGFYIREASARHGIPCITNIEFALALTRGLRHAEPRAWQALPLAAYAGLKHEIVEG